MSRHHYTMRDEEGEITYKIIVGWDPPLHSYFYQVYTAEGFADDDYPVDEGGNGYQEFVDVFSMSTEIVRKGYREIPEALATTLGVDELLEGKTRSLPFEMLGGYDDDTPTMGR